MKTIQNERPLKIQKDLLEQAKINSLISMTTQAEKQLNPLRYQLSFEAKKRLRWLYLLYYEEGGNVTTTAHRAGISRPWLSHLKSIFEKNNRDPRKLEPESKAPHNTSDRKRISRDTEKMILEIRAESRNVWGKIKIATALKRDYQIEVSPNTVNSYLHKHGKIDPKISLKNTRSWQTKIQRERLAVELRVKYRPPRKLKDLAPGALVEKDMKYVPKYVQKGAGFIGENFYSQHTETDSFTRIRSLELAVDSKSAGSAEAHRESVKNFPFKIACENTDNGYENHKDFREQLQKENIFHFYSNLGTPTDNPRVERSHLTDELEFYQRGGLKKSFEEQKMAIKEWEYFYNWKRPHQALGYLTPMEFYKLWKEKPEEALLITKKYQAYLAKQRKRLADSRRIKKEEQINTLMNFIDAKLKDNLPQINRTKSQLINCQLCSLA